MWRSDLRRSREVSERVSARSRRRLDAYSSQSPWRIARWSPVRRGSRGRGGVRCRPDPGGLRSRYAEPVPARDLIQPTSLIGQPWDACSSSGASGPLRCGAIQITYSAVAGPAERSVPPELGSRLLLAPRFGRPGGVSQGRRCVLGGGAPIVRRSLLASPSPYSPTVGRREHTPSRLWDKKGWRRALGAGFPTIARRARRRPQS